MDTALDELHDVHLAGEQTTSTPSYFRRDYRLVQQNRTTSTYALGLPETRKLFSYGHLAAVVTSLLCFVLGALTIESTLTLAWYLRFSGQIIVIGLLLGIMNLCLQTVLPFTFLLLEQRFGESRLQNYQAILSGKFIGSHISPHWRIALCSLLALPLGLSVAYKRFLGGTVSAPYNHSYTGCYGLSFPQIGTWPLTNPLYLYETSFAAFQTATNSGDATFPRADTFPLAYGYNTLLISNDSAAILDMPVGTYITQLRSGMYGNETLFINASVNAYLASYNTTSPEIMRNDSFWEAVLNSTFHFDKTPISTVALYKGFSRDRIGIMPYDSNTQTLFGLYRNSTKYDGIQFPTRDETEELDAFRKRAQICSVKRARCRGVWTLNTTSIVLVGGSCDLSIPVDSSILQRGNMVPFAYDALPPMMHTYSPYIRGKNYFFYENGTDTVWLRATYVVTVATMFWARALAAVDGGRNSTETYDKMDEVIVSVRSSLSAGWLLYLVLAVQPLLTVLGFLVSIVLHGTLIGEKFWARIDPIRRGIGNVGSVAWRWAVGKIGEAC